MLQVRNMCTMIQMQVVLILVTELQLKQWTH